MGGYRAAMEMWHRHISGAVRAAVAPRDSGQSQSAEIKVQVWEAPVVLSLSASICWNALIHRKF